MVTVPPEWKSRIVAANTYYPGRDAASPFNIGSTWEFAVGGYLAAPNAYEAWTTRQWQMFGRNYKLPIWVAGNAGEPEAYNCLRQLLYLGVKSGKTVIVDMETRVDITYLNAFYSVMNHAGFKVWVYGSASTVFTNPECNGYAVADWTGEEFMYPHPGTRLTQYANDIKPGFDEFCLRDWPIADGEIWR